MIFHCYSSWSTQAFHLYCGLWIGHVVITIWFLLVAESAFQENVSKQNFYACAWAKKACRRDISLIPSSVKLPLFKLNNTFYFKCYLQHNCSISLNWNNTQLYSSVKPLCNFSSSVSWFVHCFLPFLRRTSV